MIWKKNFNRHILLTLWHLPVTKYLANTWCRETPNNVWKIPVVLDLHDPYAGLQSKVEIYPHSTSFSPVCLVFLNYIQSHTVHSSLKALNHLEHLWQDVIFWMGRGKVAGVLFCYKVQAIKIDMNTYFSREDL